ncbi:MAG TPA: hypothetical protein VFI01_07045, partial [Gaiellaceae bacterium]|nr:hypothetical protein [Gaiellaceae bacterium]
NLGAPGRLVRIERRLGNATLEPLHDERGVEHDLAAVDEDGHERLPARLLDRRAVGRVDVDPFELDAFMACRERDALDVRRERDPVDARRDVAILCV